MNEDVFIIKDNVNLGRKQLITYFPKLKVKKLYSWSQVPKYMTTGSVGMDLYATSDFDPIKRNHSWLLAPDETMKIGCGICVEIPEGYEGQIRPRSGLSTKKNLIIPNSPGTIDNDYRGLIKVALHNIGKENQVVKAGERIAQLVIAPVKGVEIVEVNELSETLRGSGGYGSTGRQVMKLTEIAKFIGKEVIITEDFGSGYKPCTKAIIYDFEKSLEFDGFRYFVYCVTEDQDLAQRDVNDIINIKEV